MKVLDFLRGLFGRGAAKALEGLEPDRTRLIVGLGNPGPEYAETRHNVGFRCVEALARRHGAAWKNQTDALGSLVAVIHSTPELSLVLAKPQTFMNRSGKAVQDLREVLKLGTRQCLVVYDDMDLPLGALRLRERGSPGTHNGMRSVVASLATDTIPRLRIGISQAWPGEATSHVLSEFAREQRDAVDDLIERAADAALVWALEGAPKAMNRYNKA